MHTHDLLTSLKAAWSAAQPIDLPPSRDAVIWRDDCMRVFYVAREFGPPLHYPPVRRSSELESNHGWFDLKADFRLIAKIPEVRAFPKMIDLLRVINEPGSPLRSLGCATYARPIESDDPRCQVGALFVLGGYVDLMHLDPGRASDINAQLSIAAVCMHQLEGCEQCWGVSAIGVQVMKMPNKPLGLEVQFSAAGRTEEEARHHFDMMTSQLIEAFREVNSTR